MLLLLGGGLGAADAQGASDDKPPPSLLNGTPKEQAACSTDAARFCGDDIPDNFKVLACLKEHRAKLKKACKQVLEDHGQ